MGFLAWALIGAGAAVLIAVVLSVTLTVGGSGERIRPEQRDEA